MFKRTIPGEGHIPAFSRTSSGKQPVDMMLGTKSSVLRLTAFTGPAGKPRFELRLGYAGDVLHAGTVIASGELNAALAEAIAAADIGEDTD